MFQSLTVTDPESGQQVMELKVAGEQGVLIVGGQVRYAGTELKRPLELLFQKVGMLHLAVREQKTADDSPETST